MAQLTPIRQQVRTAIRKRGQLIIPKWGHLALGPELIQNGSDLVDTSFWIARASILSAIGGDLDIADAGQFSIAYQAVPTTPGKRYLYSFNTKVGSSSPSVNYGWGTQIPDDIQYANHEIRDLSPTYPDTYYMPFIADSDPTYLSLGPSSPENLRVGELSCRQVLSGYRPVIGGPIAPADPPIDPPPYVQNLVHTNGTGWLLSAAAEIANSPILEMSVWLNLDNLVASSSWTMNINNGGNQVLMRIRNDGRYEIIAQDSAGATGLSGSADPGTIPVGQLVHLYQWFDFSTDTGQLLIDGVQVANNLAFSPNNGVIGLDGQVSMLAQTSGLDVPVGAVADFFIGTGQVQGYNQFHSGGEPTDIDGLASAAQILFNGPAADWNAGTNKGLITIANQSATFIDV